jgi:hypothetical protein
MTRIFIGLLFATLAVAVGCEKGGTAGGPGATSSTAKAPMIGEADDTFKLSVSSVNVQQGEMTNASIGIKRGTNFAQDVTLTFDDLPAGVALDPAKPVLLAKATDAKFTLKATDAAVPGDYTVKLVGHPAKGGDATNQFKLTILKKDSFTLSMPFLTTGLKQGESKAVAISISRHKKFDQEVTLKFDRLPKGVTMEPATSVIKHGETEAKFLMKAADDAVLGDFSIQATGHPAKGVDVTHDFKFSVAKK